jgi:hypothetical protein
MDTESGKVVQVLDSIGATQRIYFMGTTGTVAVFIEMDANHCCFPIWWSKRRI